jgi:hypothetical protein
MISDRSENLLEGKRLLSNHKPSKLAHARVSVPTAHLPGFRTTIAEQDGNLQRIMLRAWGGLGDQICAEPTMRYALSKFKNCDFFLDSEFPELFKHLHHKFKHIYKIGEDTANYDKYFVFDMIKPPNDTNMVWQFMSHLLTNCVDFPSLCAFRLQLPVADKEIVLIGEPPQLHPHELALIKNGILIHPGAHWQIKTFPAKFWETVVARIGLSGVIPVLIGGALDDNRGTIEMDNRGCLDLRNKLKVEESIWCTQQAAVVLTNDSSPLHMAASGDAWIGYIATCKHPDMITHWRHGIWQWRERNFGKGGIWEHIDYCPNKKNQLEVEEVPQELLESWLPNPNEFAEWALEKRNEYSEYGQTRTI